MSPEMLIYFNIYPKTLTIDLQEPKNDYTFNLQRKRNTPINFTNKITRTENFSKKTWDSLILSKKL